MADPILSVESITKSFLLPDKTDLYVLEKLSLKVQEGTVVAITGASGSGKSTLLHLIGGLDTPDEGKIVFKQKDIIGFTLKERATYRNRTVGFVFQFHYLMPELTVLENVAFPGLLKGFNKDINFSKAAELLNEVGLKGKEKVMPYQLSGGERQRVAIARSLINSPDLLLADEPTGNLDWKTGERVFHLFRQLIGSQGLTAIIVTHNEQLAKFADLRYLLSAGRLH